MKSLHAVLSSAPHQKISKLQKMMYSPFCGMLTSFGFSLPGRKGPSVRVAGGELTGIHALVGLPQPKPGSYHIGGTGITGFEPAIKTLGEASERYAGVASSILWKNEIEISSYDLLISQGKSVLDPKFLRVFDYEAPNFNRKLFSEFTRDLPVGWLLAQNLGEGCPEEYIPVQRFSIGYAPRASEGEKRFDLAVSTGTAAHTSYERALLAAALEIIQVDAAMGYWYGNDHVVQIEFDRRVQNVARVIDRHMPKGGYNAQFYYLGNPDLPGFVVACVVREPLNREPVVSVGLGAATTLEEAIYRAWLEGIGVRSLAEWSLVNYCIDSGGAELSVDSMLDLDSSVIHAASPNGAKSVTEHFDSAEAIGASDLPADLSLDPAIAAKQLIEAFSNTGKQLFYADLTMPDIDYLGFKVVRLWSPQTLSLCLPSMPQSKHPRYRDYGGFDTNFEPHPYP